MPPYAMSRGVARALRRRCPVCGDRAISPSTVRVERRCPQCGLDLERQVGSFIGGVGLNTIVSFALLIIVLTVGFVATGGEASVSRVLVPALAVAATVPIAFAARSKLCWVALELRWWPLQQGEVDIEAIPR